MTTPPSTPIEKKIREILYPPLPHSHIGPQPTDLIEVTWKKEGIEHIINELLTLYKEQLEGERERLRGIVKKQLSEAKTWGGDSRFSGSHIPKGNCRWCGAGEGDYHYRGCRDYDRIVAERTLEAILLTLGGKGP